MRSPTISALRTQYASLKSRADAEARIYGPRHPTLLQTQSELSGLQNEIQAERERMVQAARNDLDQAKAVVAALGSDASTVSSGVFSDNDAEVQLRDLIRDAAAKTAIYEAFLARVGEVTERQQLDTTNIRVISPPVPPRNRSWPPRTIQMAGFGAIVGMVAGILGVLGTAIVREVGGSDVRRPVADTAVAQIEIAPAEPETRAEARLAPRSGSLLSLAGSPARASSPLPRWASEQRH